MNLFNQILTSVLLMFLTQSLVADSAAIQWQQWGKTPFEQARQADKLILLDVGIEGCTACRWMDEITYTHSEVIELINDHFVAIVADAEAQPDIGERYSDWSWPATIFMTAEGTQILALAGNRRPQNFIPILEKIIDQKQAGNIVPDELAPYSAPPKAVETDITVLRDRLRGQLDNRLNENGGWQKNGISTTTGAQLQHLYLRAHMYDNDELKRLALKTSSAYLNAIDPVWGGVYVRYFDKAPARFKGLNGVPEKRIANQASALIAFSHAYSNSGDKKYLAGIAAIDKFLNDWMKDEDNTFYTSQEDDPPHLQDNMSTIDYWLIDNDQGRQKYGIPPIDHAAYTDKNAQLINAYVITYESTGDDSYLKTAINAIDSLLHNRKTEKGWVLQSHATESIAGDDRMRPLVTHDKPYLSTQAWMGRALLALYRATGDSNWLDHAVTIADAMLTNLYDRKNGGFYSTTPDATATIVPPRKPLELNAVAAHFIYDLWVYTKNGNYAEIPETTIRAVATPEIVRREGRITGQTALLLEKLTAAYVEFSVVGEPDHEDAQALFNAARDIYHPRKLMHFEKSGRYPSRNDAALYICNPDKCSIPIMNPDDVAGFAERFRLPASNSGLFEFSG